MQQFKLTVTTENRGLHDITSQIASYVADSGLEIGLCHIFIQHTSASLIINENYDVQVQRDLEAFMQRLIPDGDPLFKHVDEGPDDMPSHVKTALTSSSLLIPISAGKLALGIYQAIYLWEHRLQQHTRKLIITLY